MFAAGDARDGLFGTSPAIAELRSYLAKVAMSDATVLVTGETGTGKERVAHAVHNMGPRAKGPFVSVNCAAIPEALLESELFGHRRGAFTGATSDFAGRFAEAHGGTLFLDEIGEMSAPGQAKLLRVLEDREIAPVGSSSRRKVDIRLVAATNSELEDMVNCRSFRADLYYRLNVVRIELPPLRDRPEDILPILDHFIGLQNRRRELNVGRPNPQLLARMCRYDWPGNVRELRNLVEAMFVDPPSGRSVGLSDLPPAFRRLFTEHPRAGKGERERLAEVLRETNWNKMAAAREMNWSRMTLYRKLAKYDLGQGEPD
ncbi:sigma-54 interaction domain-containing protein [Sphingorhabdus buctiana]|uniref:Sigma-54 interaction domain-containing protein n=1 Tax=Sphingorhabdus buctiana TaxID=1508805 RepID=A0ABW4MCK6_9SPHN